MFAGGRLRFPAFITHYQPLAISPDAAGWDDSPARELQDDTNTHSTVAGVDESGEAVAVWRRRRGVQCEAKLNDLWDAGSPREAKWPSVILHTQAGSTPTSSLSRKTLFLSPAACYSVTHFTKATDAVPSLEQTDPPSIPVYSLYLRQIEVTGWQVVEYFVANNEADSSKSLCRRVESICPLFNNTGWRQGMHCGQVLFLMLIFGLWEDTEKTDICRENLQTPHRNALRLSCIEMMVQTTHPLCGRDAWSINNRKITADITALVQQPLPSYNSHMINVIIMFWQETLYFLDFLI